MLCYVGAHITKKVAVLTSILCVLGAENRFSAPTNHAACTLFALFLISNSYFNVLCLELFYSLKPPQLELDSKLLLLIYILISISVLVQIRPSTKSTLTILKMTPMLKLMMKMMSKPNNQQRWSPVYIVVKDVEVHMELRNMKKIVMPKRNWNFKFWLLIDKFILFFENLENTKVARPFYSQFWRTQCSLYPKHCVQK